MARAPTEEHFQSALTNLQMGEMWSANEKLQNWMISTWLPEKKRWVWAYRKDRFNVKLNTNNGVERQTRSFKYQFLSEPKRNDQGLGYTISTKCVQNVY